MTNDVNTNNTSELIKLPNGWKIEVERKGIFEANVWLIDPSDCVVMRGSMMHPELFASAMQPQVSESEEAVERALELVRMIAEYPHKTLHEAGLVAKAKEAYQILSRHRSTNGSAK